MRKLAVLGFLPVLATLAGCGTPPPNTYSRDVFDTFQRAGATVAQGVEHASSATVAFVREKTTTVSLSTPVPTVERSTSAVAPPAQSGARGLTSQEPTLQNPAPPATAEPAPADPDDAVTVQPVIRGEGDGQSSLTYEDVSPARKPESPAAGKPQQE